MISRRQYIHHSLLNAALLAVGLMLVVVSAWYAELPRLETPVSKSRTVFVQAQPVEEGLPLPPPGEVTP